MIRDNRDDDDRRVVAALSACRGIPTVLLEVGLVQRLIANRIAELINGDRTLSLMTRSD